MKKAIVLLLLAATAAAAIWFYKRQNDLPQVPFSKVARETISNTLSTNGKVEPIEFIEVRTDVSGLVKSLPVQAGAGVRQGQLLATLSQPGAEEELASAEARAAQAKAELEALQSGGRLGDRAEIEGSVNRLRQQRQAAQTNLESLERLLKAGAVTAYESAQAAQLVRDLDVQLDALGHRKDALVGKTDLTASAARLREAEVAIRLAKTHLAQNTIHSPMAGVLYSLPAKLGAYLQPGDAVGSVGRLEPVRVRVYVDEPELGRVAAGQAVRITWDAVQGREWTGTVARRPAEVVSLGTRQVGEVLCTVANPDGQLVPGTNVNAFILTQVVPNALTIPKTAVRRDSGVGVFVLEGTGSVRWQQVKTGASDALRVEITSGLKDGDAVALPTNFPLKNGAQVKAFFQ